jgi:hypothetical protein
MRTFVLFLNDDRDTAPQLIFVTTTDENRAKELANRELRKSRHYQSIDVREGDTLFYRLGRSGNKDFYPSPMEA